jgi:hypothetical protein
VGIEHTPAATDHPDRVSQHADRPPPPPEPPESGTPRADSRAQAAAANDKPNPSSTTDDSDRSTSDRGQPFQNASREQDHPTRDDQRAEKSTHSREGYSRESVNDYSGAPDQRHETGSENTSTSRHPTDRHDDSETQTRTETTNGKRADLNGGQTPPLDQSRSDTLSPTDATAEQPPNSSEYPQGDNRLGDHQSPVETDIADHRTETFARTDSIASRNTADQTAEQSPATDDDSTPELLGTAPPTARAESRANAEAANTKQSTDTSPNIDTRHTPPRSHDAVQDPSGLPETSDQPGADEASETNNPTEPSIDDATEADKHQETDTTTRTRADHNRSSSQDEGTKPGQNLRGVDGEAGAQSTAAEIKARNFDFSVDGQNLREHIDPAAPRNDRIEGRKEPFEPPDRDTPWTDRDLPTVEELTKPDDKKSRFERLRRTSYEVADDVIEATDKAADTVQSLLSKKPPAVETGTRSVHPAIETPPHHGIDGGDTATALLMLGVVLGEGARSLVKHARRRKKGVA